MRAGQGYWEAGARVALHLPDLHVGEGALHGGDRGDGFGSMGLAIEPDPLTWHTLLQAQRKGGAFGIRSLGEDSNTGEKFERTHSGPFFHRREFDLAFGPIKRRSPRNCEIAFLEDSPRLARLLGKWLGTVIKKSDLEHKEISILHATPGDPCC